MDEMFLRKHVMFFEKTKVIEGFQNEDEVSVGFLFLDFIVHILPLRIS